MEITRNFKEQSDLKGVNINYEQLQQLHAFQTGVIKFTPQYKNVPNRFFSGSERVIKNFDGLTSFLPFKLPSQFTKVFIQNEPKNPLNFQDEPIDPINLQVPKITEQLGELAMKHGRLVSVGKINYNKKVGIIYNPNSGKKRDVRSDIVKTLSSKQIPYQIYETQGYMDAWRIVQDMNFEEHSALVAVGGDGTLHEVVNGMMFRKDKKRIPIAMIPNGSGNDTCKSIGINSIDKALLHIQKGDLLKVDLNQVYIDADSFEEIDLIEGELKFQRGRYSLINAGLGFVAKCVHSAIRVKHWAGQASYFVAALQQFFGGEQPDNYRMTVLNQIGDKQVATYQQNVQSLLFVVMNGRNGGGGMPFTPAALMNDGLLDIAFYNDVLQAHKIPSIMNNLLLKYGTHAYQPDWTHLRGSKVILENLNYEPDSMNDIAERVTPVLKKKRQMFQVDGEGLTFMDKVTLEVCHEAIELIVDFEMLMHQSEIMRSKV